jgi:hypothetical protein
VHRAAVSMRLRRRGPSCCRIVEHGHLAFTRSQLPMRADAARRVMNHAGNDAFPPVMFLPFVTALGGSVPPTLNKKQKKKHRVRQRDRSVRAPPKQRNPSQ